MHCIGNSSCELKLCFCGTEKPFSVVCIEMLQTGIKHPKAITTRSRVVFELYIGQGMVESSPVTQQAFFDLLIDPECFNTVNTGYFYGLSNTCMYREPDHVKHFYSCLPTLLETLLCVDLSGASLKLLRIVSSLTKEAKLNTLILKDYESPEVACVVKALTANKCLKTLDLSGSHLPIAIHTTELSPVMLHVPGILSVTLSEMLQVNRTLQVLKLNDCCLTKYETSMLFKIFANNQNNTLRTLAISDNCYNTKHFEEMLSSNSSLHCVEVTVTPGAYPTSQLSLMKRPSHPLPPKRCTKYLQSPTRDTEYLSFSQDAPTFSPIRKNDMSDHRAKLESESKFYSRPGMLAYVGDDDTLDSVCQVIVSVVSKNTTLQHLIIHTSFSKDLLYFTLMRCPNSGAVKHSIQIRSSRDSS